MSSVGARLVRIRRVAELLRPYRLRTGAATAAITLATLATLAPPYLAGRAIDDVINGRSTEQLDEIVLAMVGALVLGWLALYAQTYLIEWVGQHALRDLRTRLFAHVQTLSISYFNRHSAGTLISRLTNNVETLDQLVTDGVSALVTSVVTIVGAVVVLFVLDLELALVTTGVIPLLAAGTWIYSRRSAPIYTEALHSIATVTENLEESLSGARVVRAFAQEQRHERAFDVVNGQNREVNDRALNLIVLYLPFVQLISIGSIALVAVVGGFQVMDGDQSLGIVVSFIGYLRLALSPLPQIGTLFTLYQQGSAALDQSFELLAEKPDVIERRGARELSGVRGEVEFDHIDFAYDPGHQVLSDVSFKVAPGTTVAIVGSTGCGKTTLINLLPRFYDPTRGRVLGETLGLGKASGIEITGEQPGVLPGPDWMRINYPREKWTSAYTANVSIGQGYDLVSPLQLAMVYATVANGGVSYFPRLIKDVVGTDGKSIRNENGQPVISQGPKMHGDLREDFRPEQIEMARRGLWKVVNEDGGTGGRARLPGVQVAGKTGTAQAMTEGKKDTIAWFACFAPYDNPKYAIAVMVQGGAHGGSVAAPIATRILERTLAMDEGRFDPQLAWLAPANKPNLFAMIEAVDFKGSGPNLPDTDEERLAESDNANVQMAADGAQPDVEPEADARGKVAPRSQRVARALPVAPPPPPQKRNFFQRLFGARPTPAPAATPQPARHGAPPRR